MRENYVGASESEAQGTRYFDVSVETEWGFILDMTAHKTSSAHGRNFSIDTNDSDASVAIPPGVVIRTASPMRCFLPIRVPRVVEKTEGNFGAAAVEYRPREPRLPSLRKTLPITKRERKIKFNNFACLLEAAMEGDLNELRSLMEKEKLHPDTCNADGVTPLHCAAGTCRIELVKYLIKMGANVNVADDHGWTPLHSAAYTNDAAIVEVLLENGADVEALDAQGQAPIGISTDHKVVKLMGEVVRRKNCAEYVIAMHEFDKSDVENAEGNELSFRKGARLRILAREDPDWWLAEESGRKGYVPRQFVQ
jgi:hypothetical protein